ncbi:MAG TPA: sigma-70 family RNA polymerase sigma factor [Armatimonadota bacterium]
MTPTPDEELVADCLAGNNVAFEELMARYEDSLFRLAYYWTGNRDDAQDLCQDCFIHLYHVLPKYDRQYRFAVWMYKVCTNNCINWLKRHRRRPPAMSLSSLLGEEVEIPDTLPLPEQTLLASEDRKAVMDAVNALPPAYRMPIILKYLEDFSYKEIAQMLNISVKNVEIRLHRAKGMLQKTLRSGIGRAKA